MLVGLFFGQRTDESSSVVLEAFLLRHLLWGRVLRHRLEEGLKQRVIVFAGMDSLEPHVFDA